MKRRPFVSLATLSVFLISILVPVAAHAAPAHFHGMSGLAAAMVSGNTTAAVAGLASAGYLFLFLAIFLEGTLVTSAAAFAAALGYLDIWAILGLALAGDYLGDLGYYTVGYWTRAAVVKKYGRRFGLSPSRIARFEQSMHTRPLPMMLFLKMAPMSAPGLLLVGASRMPLKRFLRFITVIVLPKTLFFIALGYFFGAEYSTFVKYTHSGVYYVIIVAILLLLVYLGYRKLTNVVAESIEVEP